MSTDLSRCVQMIASLQICVPSIERLQRSSGYICTRARLAMSSCVPPLMHMCAFVTTYSYICIVYAQRHRNCRHNTHIHTYDADVHAIFMRNTFMMHLHVSILLSHHLRSYYWFSEGQLGVLLLCWRCAPCICRRSSFEAFDQSCPGETPHAVNIRCTPVESAPPDLTFGRCWIFAFCFVFRPAR